MIGPTLSSRCETPACIVIDDCDDQRLPTYSWARRYLPTHKIVVSDARALRSLPKVNFLVERHMYNYSRENDIHRNQQVLMDQLKPQDGLWVEASSSVTVNVKEFIQTKGFTASVPVRGWDHPLSVLEQKMWVEEVDPAMNTLFDTVGDLERQPVLPAKTVEQAEAAWKLLVCVLNCPSLPPCRQLLQQGAVAFKMYLKILYDAFKRALATMRDEQMVPRASHMVEQTLKKGEYRYRWIMTGKAHCSLHKPHRGTLHEQAACRLLAQSLKENNLSWAVFIPRKAVLAIDR